VQESVQQGPVSAEVARPLPRTVIVSPFSPLRDGTAKYADQLVASLQEQRPVLPIGLPGSATSVVRRLDGGLRPLRLLVLTARGDELWLMWHPQYFISGRAWSRIGSYLSLGIVLRARHGGINVQVADMPFVPAARPPRSAVRRAEEMARRWFWRSAARLVFHSEWEREQIFSRFGPLPATVEMVVHGSSYRPYVEVSQAEARRRIGLHPTPTLFLCIGFIGHAKGFDRALEAFARVQPTDAELHLVGSVPYETDDAHRYVEALRQRVAEVPGAHLKVAWVDDEEFDLWVQAADVVLAPYRVAASSGVIGRAKIHGRRVIASRVGGLPEQLGEGDAVVGGDAELAEAMASVAPPLTTRAQR